MLFLQKKKKNSLVIVCADEKSVDLWANETATYENKNMFIM